MHVTQSIELCTGLKESCGYSTLLNVRCVKINVTNQVSEAMHFPLATSPPPASFTTGLVTEKKNVANLIILNLTTGLYTIFK